MTTRLRVALAQLELRDGDPSENLSRAEQAIARAAAQGCQLVLLPELWSTGYCVEQWPELAEPLDTGTAAATAELARRHRITIAGSLLERGRDGLYNTLVVQGPDGAQLAAYRKMHLFAPMGETRMLRPGPQPESFDAPWGRTGLAVCYDLRFPELFRWQALHGAQVLLIVSAWPAVRAEQWRALLRARAIENQALVVAVNRAGAGHQPLAGRSAVIDPWGRTIAEADDAPTVVVAEVDISLAATARAEFPALADARPEWWAPPAVIPGAIP
jgi:predicted amidohydrolase